MTIPCASVKLMLTIRTNAIVGALDPATSLQKRNLYLEAISSIIASNTSVCFKLTRTFISLLVIGMLLTLGHLKALFGLTCSVSASRKISLYMCKGLKSIRVHLDPGSQLVCVATQKLVIVTTVHIFVANLRVESVRAP